MQWLFDRLRSVVVAALIGIGAGFVAAGFHLPPGPIGIGVTLIAMGVVIAAGI